MGGLIPHLKGNVTSERNKVNDERFQAGLDPLLSIFLVNAVDLRVKV
jgi:hypothetical protein